MMVFPPQLSVSELELAFWLSGLAVGLPSNPHWRAESCRPQELLFARPVLTEWPREPVVAQTPNRSPEPESPAGVLLPAEQTDPLPTSCAGILPCRQRGSPLNSVRQGCSKASCENRANPPWATLYGRCARGVLRRPERHDLRDQACRICGIDSAFITGQSSRDESTTHSHFLPVMYRRADAFPYPRGYRGAATRQ